MRVYKTEKIMPKNGTLSLEALPFQEGEAVEIIVLPLEKQVNTKKEYPLRGKVIKYEKPFEPVAQDDWNVLK
jgi:hypothetical protein